MFNSGLINLYTLLICSGLLFTLDAFVFTYKPKQHLNPWVFDFIWRLWLWLNTRNWEVSYIINDYFQTFFLFSLESENVKRWLMPSDDMLSSNHVIFLWIDCSGFHSHFCNSLKSLTKLKSVSSNKNAQITTSVLCFVFKTQSKLPNEILLGRRNLRYKDRRNFYVQK